jgi:hypothetical protein
MSNLSQLFEVVVLAEIFLAQNLKKFFAGICFGAKFEKVFAGNVLAPNSLKFGAKIEDV